MKHQDLRMLVQWMEVADLACVEMSTPPFSVRIVRRPQGGTGGQRSEAAGGTAPRQSATLRVKSDACGVFMAAHPLQGLALAACGARVAAGDVLGLTMVGAILYLPVLAPCDGRVIRRLVADGDPVEAGAALFEFEPAAG